MNVTCLQEEMERFPLTLLADITAVTNSNRRDIYNNIVLFTVQEDRYKRSPSEMHLFQVLGKPVSKPLGLFRYTFTVQK